MADTTEKQVRNGLLVLGRRLERRALYRGVWDALRNVRPAGEGEDSDPSYIWEHGERFPSAIWDVDWYPPYIRELARSTTSTLELLGVEAQETVGPHNATVRRLQALVYERETDVRTRTEERTHAEAGVPLQPTRTEGRSPAAKDPDAQGRRQVRLVAERVAGAEAALSSVRAQLEEAIALRAAAVAPLRQAALQIHSLGEACQHCYWAWRLRFSRRKHGARPVAHHLVVGLPDWVTRDDVLFDTTPRPTVTVASGDKEEAA